MNTHLVSAQDEHRAPSAPFRLREFWRVIVLIRPYRGRLFMGLLFTVAFACLHTLSISGAFPVFKILLETEGLNGWVNRVVAGERLGVEFGPLADPDVVRVLKVHGADGSHVGTLQEGLELRDSRGRPASELLHELATIETGNSITVQLTKSGDTSFITLSPGKSDRPMRLLAWAASKIPVDTNERKLATLAYVLAALAMIAIASNVFRYFGEIWIAEAILRGMMDLRDILYERTLRLPMTFFSSRPIADIVTRFVQDIQEIQRGLITLFGKFIREPMRAIFLLTTALLLDWRITLIAALAAPAAIAIFWTVGRAVKAANKKLLQAYGMMIGALTTSLQNLRVVKAYTAEDQERQCLDVVDRSMFKQQLKLARLDAFVGPMMETIAVLGGGFLSLWLLNRVVNHELSLAKFATLGVALSVLFDPLRKLSDVWVRIQRSIAATERIFQVVDQPVEGDETRGGVQLAPLKSAIEFDQVTFTYPDAKQPALREVSLTIRHGETVAIVGPNGSGKTTLVSLLLRLFEPDAGEIRYDGLDIRKADLQSLRRRIGMVTQDAIVFAGTPIENITYGAAIKRQNAETPKRRNEEIANQADDASGFSPNGRVEEAARRAFADEFIRQIPGAYSASLGERGTTLSGGQRQRLAIARAVYRDAPILIFDEATSQIDSESELKIQTALKEFSVGRTTLIIAHRLSTIQFAGRIVVMEAGRIIDEGAHAELFNRCALYRTLCETQFVGENRGS